VLAALGDSITTDHISPAGSIAKDSPAGRYLRQHGVEPRDFNSYGSRRGNDRVMDAARSPTPHPQPSGAGDRRRRDEAPARRRAALDLRRGMKYQSEGVPLVVLAGCEYGSGSSRDWAAKGTLLLGVRAVMAVSYERIHRSNLVGMGVLPLEFPDGQTWKSIGLTGKRRFDVLGLGETLQPGSILPVEARSADGAIKNSAVAPHRHAGRARLLPQRRNSATVLRKLARRRLKNHA